MKGPTVYYKEIFDSLCLAVLGITVANLRFRFALSRYPSEWIIIGFYSNLQERQPGPLDGGYVAVKHGL